MKGRALTLALLAAIALLAGCKDPERELETARFASVYVRLRLASAGLEGQSEKARTARTEVLHSERMDLVGYRRRLKELQSDPDRWEAFWDRVQILTDSIETKTKKKGS